MDKMPTFNSEKPTLPFSSSQQQRTKDFVEQQSVTSGQTGARTRFETRPRTAAEHVSRIFGALKRRLVPGSSPSESATNTDLERTHSFRSGRENIVSMHAEFQPARRRSSLTDLSHGLDPAVDDSTQVDVVVVDRDFQEVLYAAKGESQEDIDYTAASDITAAHAIDQHAILGAGLRTGNQSNKSTTNDKPNERNSTVHDASQSNMTEFLNSSKSWLFLRWRLSPAVLFFFHSAFPDPEKEKSYIKEAWFMGKPAALASSLFLLLAAVSSIVAMPHPLNTYAKIFYTGLGLLTVVFLLPTAALDWPRKRPVIWQILLFFGTWTYAWVTVMDMWNCGFYTANNKCPQKDFVGIFFYALGFPTLSAFMLREHRAAHSLGAIIYVILCAVFLIPERVKFVRNLINFILYHIAILWAGYLKEKSDRRMFSLREQLKIQYKATQKAQVAEREAAESKKRFVSYIFHEVRVPLNTALLSFQNLEGEKVFNSVASDQREMVTGLSSSLITMEKVLNDVLDFNRMEAGKLTWSSKPFDIHATFRAMLMAFRGVAQARNIDLVTDFDSAIDEFSPLVMGDEMRFSQVISNLTSNACKFTQNGKVKFVTRLLHPVNDATPPTLTPPLLLTSPTEPIPHLNRVSAASTQAGHASEITAVASAQMRKDIAIIRIEIIDEGVGIRPRDLTDNRLFSPYVQTDIGRRQGGKGSGLGLALVRKIVKLSGGRLGVTSVVNKGSTFWIEMAFEKPKTSGVTMSPQTAAVHATGLRDKRSTLALPPTPGTPVRRRSVDQSPNPSIHKPELVASQIPTGNDIQGIPIHPLPALTPVEERTQGDLDYSVRALKALVVDDDPLTRKLMTRMLTRLGHEVMCAEDGLIALNLLRDAWRVGNDSAFDILFLDNQMPNMTGVECVREMRRIGLQTFVVGVTGNALVADQKEYLDAGASQLLTKPVLEKNIRNALQEARDHLRALADRKSASGSRSSSYEDQSSGLKRRSIGPRPSMTPLQTGTPGTPIHSASETLVNPDSFASRVEQLRSSEHPP